MPSVVAPALRSPTTKRNQFGGKCGDRKTTFIAKGASVAHCRREAVGRESEGRAPPARGPARNDRSQSRALRALALILLAGARAAGAAGPARVLAHAGLFAERTAR